jgi:hypothetical protein
MSISENTPLAGGSVELSVYGSTLNEEPILGSVVKKRYCSLKKVVIGAAIVAIAAIGGIIGLIVAKEECKTTLCAGKEQYSCDCIDPAVYQKYLNGTYTCSPCEDKPNRV